MDVMIFNIFYLLLGHAGSCTKEGEEDSQLRDFIFNNEKDVIANLHAKLAKYSPRKSENRWNDILLIKSEAYQ